MPNLTWNLDQESLQTFNRVKPIIPGHQINVSQFQGRNYNVNSWINVIEQENFINELNINSLSSPDNIIKCFMQDFLLEGLSMVVLWGTMSRQKRKIYNSGLPAIKHYLEQSKISIADDLTIENAWRLLTQNLGWSKVMTSKVLHFLCRSLCMQNPPVPIDNKIIYKKVWRPLSQFLSNNNIPRIPGWFRDNTFETYNRYMTALIIWSTMYNLSTKEFETALFNYSQNNNLNFELTNGLN